MILTGSCIWASSAVVFLESPPWLVVCLILQTAFLSIMVGAFTSMWYTYILILVFLGGLLVIFTYVGGLTGKVKMEYYLTAALLKSGGLSVIFVLVYFFFTESLTEKSSVGLFSEGESGVLSGMAAVSSASGYEYCVLYLFLTLLCVCWMAKEFEGPLRLSS